MKTDINEWYTLPDRYPQWYEIVTVELVTGELKEVWLAWEDENLWTEYSTDRVYHDEEIVRWTRDKCQTITEV